MRVRPPRKGAAARSIERGCSVVGIGCLRAVAPDRAGPGGIRAEAPDHVDMELRARCCRVRRHSPCRAWQGSSSPSWRADLPHEFEGLLLRQIGQSRSRHCGAEPARTRENGHRSEAGRTRATRSPTGIVSASSRESSLKSDVIPARLAEVAAGCTTPSLHGRRPVAAPIPTCVPQAKTPYRRREVGEGRLTRQLGQVRKEAALTRPNGSSSSLPPRRFSGVLSLIPKPFSRWTTPQPARPWTKSRPCRASR